MDIFGPLNGKSRLYLTLQVSIIIHRSGGHIRNTVISCDHRHIFLAGSVTHGCGRGFGTIGGKAGTLNAGIHIGFIVIANIEDIVPPFQHAADTLKANVGGAAVTSLGNDIHWPFLQSFVGGFHSGCDRRRVFKEAVQKGDTPGRIRIR